ncbi:hypothetical protein HK104_001582, partial [Borealophlyctis nickersoniae]
MTSLSTPSLTSSTSPGPPTFSRPVPKDKISALFQKSKHYGAAEALLSQMRSQQVELQSGVDTEAGAKKINVLKDPANYRTEREMNLRHFKELMAIFKAASSTASGKMSMAEFKSAFSVVLGHDLTDEQMDLLFMKIDANTDDAIDWDEFSTFMLLRAQGQTAMQEAAETRLFDVDGRSRIGTPHKELVNRILVIPGVRRLVTCSREGTVCYWSDGLKLQRCFKNVAAKRPQSAPSSRKKGFAPVAPRLAGGIHDRWIHDCIYIESMNKIAIASDDHEVTLYDYTTMQPTLRLDLHDTVALTLDTFHTLNPDHPDRSTTSILFGTDSGCIITFTFPAALLLSLSTSKKDHPPPSIPLTSTSFKHLPEVTIVKRRAHRDWCMKVRWYEELKSVVSCSPDSRRSLVVLTEDGKGRWTETVVGVYKGVNTFAYCRFPVTLVTGGTDRHIRLWNPHRLTNPITSLRGHASPILDICINHLHGQAISLSTDKQIKIWDIRKQSCLQSIGEGVHYRPEDSLSCVVFLPDTESKEGAEQESSEGNASSGCSGGGRLITTNSCFVVYKLKEPMKGNGAVGGVVGTGVTEKVVKSHDHPVRAALYNTSFKQVVSGCDGGVISVWDVVSGAKTFQFSDAHGKSEITAMAFDAGGRRLITGGRDGTIRIWNFNNGQQHQELVKGDESEVTSIAYIDMRDSQYIVTTGWNRCITAFPDTQNSFTLYPTVTWPPPPTPSHPHSPPWHNDDILALAFCPPHILATASYDGEIVLCNLGSGHVLHRLKPEPWGGGSRSIDKVMFLTDRPLCATTSNLVTCGGDGIIRFWNAELGTQTLAIDGTHGRGEGIYAMQANSLGTVLVTGDAFGYVTSWDIRETCVDEAAQRRSFHEMPVLKVFRAHVRGIVSVDLAEGWECVVTASTDCSIRLFTMKGEFIGTFGQPDLWDISNQLTYRHPAKPHDVVTAEIEETADQEAVERLRKVAHKFKTKHLPPLPSSASNSSPDAQTAKTSLIPPIPLSTQKSFDTVANPPPQVPPTPPKTADVLKLPRTRYSTTRFAREFHNKFPHNRAPAPYVSSRIG